MTEQYQNLRDLVGYATSLTKKKKKKKKKKGHWSQLVDFFWFIRVLHNWSELES